MGGGGAEPNPIALLVYASAIEGLRQQTWL